MANSPNIGAVHLIQNPSAPEIPLNTSLDLLDEAIAGILVHDMASDADYTLSTASTPKEWQYGEVHITDTGVNLATGRNVIVPTNKKVYIFRNATAQTLTIKTSVGTGIAVSAGSVETVRCDGVNVVATTGSGASMSNLVDDATPQLGGPLDANSKQIRESKGANIASASTLSIPSDGNYFNVTGTVTITGFSDVAIGTEITLEFDAVLVLTHHATDLKLPTQANITTAAGDVGIFRQYAVGDWKCVNYEKANGQSVAGVAASALDMPVVTKSGAYTVVAGDVGKMLACDATSGPLTVTLLAAATAGDGFTIAVKKTDNANNVTIDGDGTETIDGSTTKVISAQHDTYFLTCDGSNWQVIAQPASGATDSDAIHDNVSGEIAAITEKTTFDPDDNYLLEDSEASDVKKRQKGSTLLGVEENAQTGTSYTLVADDAFKIVTMTNAAASTLTIPPNSSVAFPVGTQLIITQQGAGQVTLTEGSGVTINAPDGTLTLRAQYSSVSLIKMDTDEWVAAGDLG